MMASDNNRRKPLDINFWKAAEEANKVHEVNNHETLETREEYDYVGLESVTTVPIPSLMTSEINEQSNDGLHKRNDPGLRVMTDEEYVSLSAPIIRVCTKCTIIWTICSIAGPFLAFFVFILIRAKLSMAIDDYVGERIILTSNIWIEHETLEDAIHNNAWAKQMQTLKEQCSRSTEHSHNVAKEEEQMTNKTDLDQINDAIMEIMNKWEINWEITEIACDQDSPYFVRGVIRKAPACTNITKLHNDLVEHALEHSMAASGFLHSDYSAPVPKICICLPSSVEVKKEINSFRFFDVVKRAEKTAIFIDEAHYYSSSNSLRELPEWLVIHYSEPISYSCKEWRKITVKVYEPDKVNCLLRCDELMPTHFNRIVS